MKNWLTLLLLLALPVSAQSQTFDTSFFSSDVGDWWLHRFTGTGIIGSEEGLREITRIESIGGTTVFVGRWQTGPLAETESWSNFAREEGSLLWREVGPDGPGTLTIDYQPPLLLAPPTITIGTPFETSGLLSWHHTHVGTGTGTYRVESRILRVEAATVPFGTFPAIVAEEDGLFVLLLPGGGFASTGGTATSWVVPGIGTVRVEILPLDGGRLVAELLDTNREFVPEPTALLGQPCAIAAVLTFAMRRRRQQSYTGRSVG